MWIARAFHSCTYTLAASERHARVAKIEQTLEQ
jgi:hypothetical protein